MPWLNAVRRMAWKACKCLGLNIFANLNHSPPGSRRFTSLRRTLSILRLLQTPWWTRFGHEVEKSTSHPRLRASRTLAAGELRRQVEITKLILLSTAQGCTAIG